MVKHRVCVENVKGFNKLDVTFDFSSHKLIVLTGKNGIGKTTLIKAFKLLTDAQVFDKTSSQGALNGTSKITLELHESNPVVFKFSDRFKSLDTRDRLPPEKEVKAELPIPFGDRFSHYSDIASVDPELRANYAASNYETAVELKQFFVSVYGVNTKFEELLQTRISGKLYYFVKNTGDYYQREDHFSSGEFFLIQLFRLIKSGAKLIIIDEVDIALDASAQIRIYKALDEVLAEINCSVILVSHSLALMKTVPVGALCYLENNNEGLTLEPRSFGYIKSDLFGFRGRDRYILTEDRVLKGFIEYIINKFNIKTFYQYEIIEVGGQPQIEGMLKSNQENEIFGAPNLVIAVVDGDIFEKIRNRSESDVISGPVADIELFIWKNRVELLSDATIAPFKEAKKDKDTAKTYWNKLIRSNQKTEQDLYQIIIDQNDAAVAQFSDHIKQHLTVNI